MNIDALTTHYAKYRHNEELIDVLSLLDEVPSEDVIKWAWCQLGSSEYVKFYQYINRLINWMRSDHILNSLAYKRVKESLNIFDPAVNANLKLVSPFRSRRMWDYFIYAFVLQRKLHKSTTDNVAIELKRWEIYRLLIDLWIKFMSFELELVDNKKLEISNTLFMHNLVAIQRNDAFEMVEEVELVDDVCTLVDYILTDFDVDRCLDDVPDVNDAILNVRLKEKHIAETLDLLWRAISNWKTDQVANLQEKMMMKCIEVLDKADFKDFTLAFCNCNFSNILSKRLLEFWDVDMNSDRTDKDGDSQTGNPLRKRHWLAQWAELYTSTEYHDRNSCNNSTSLLDHSESDSSLSPDTEQSFVVPDSQGSS
ncbi:hypothetical protein DAMA08_046070 [Martiniozyma asiatica (nom. inval.)]|nr:hypothetical protein DAMA08_046070 [Martiniozyma asiatica]